MQNENENNPTFENLRAYKIRNVNNLVIGSININSIRNKFDQLKILVDKNVDISGGGHPVGFRHYDHLVPVGGSGRATKTS